MKKTVSYILFVGLLYLFLFNPPYSIFRGLFSVGNILILFSIAFALMKPNVIRNYYSYFKKEFILLLFLTFYVVFRTLIGGDKSYIAQHIIGICELFLVIPMILYYAKQIELRTESQIVMAFLSVGIVASFISILCLTDPALNVHIKNNLLRLSMDDYIMVNDYRGFGYSTLLTSDYGYILGLIAGYSSLFLKDRKLLYFTLPFLIFAAIINARTGAILALLIIGASLLSKRDIKYVVAVSILVFLVINFSTELFEFIGVDSRTLEWSLSVFSEADAVSRGNIEDSFAADVMFNEMIVFPPSVAEWIVGRGHSIVAGGAQHSDIGWILQLNYGGLIYIGILYSFFLVILKKLLKKRELIFFWIVLVYILLINTKSSIYPGYASFYLLFLYYAMKIIPSYHGLETTETSKFVMRKQ